MFVLERSITKAYWEPTQWYLIEHMRRGWSWVGNTRVAKIECTKTGKAYAMLDVVNGACVPVGWIWLRRRAKWTAYEVHQTFVLKNYRGMGYAETMYKAAVNVDGVLLASGPSHTKYSAGLWRKFVRNSTFNVWAQDFKNLGRTSQVYLEDDKLVSTSNLDIYHLPYSWQDVRLVAQRKHK